MNFWKIIFRSLQYYRRTHIWVVLGTMVSTAILVGALVVGDSVRFSLRQLVFDRLGKTQFVLSSGDRFFRAKLAENLSEILKTTVVPVLHTKGIAIAGGGRKRINKIQVFGINSGFGKIGDVEEHYQKLLGDEAIVNQYLAFRLDLKPGDEFLLRIEKLDYLPKDVPLALDSDLDVALRLKVKKIATDSELGRFSLKTDQTAPYSVFLSLDFLSREMNLTEQANLLLLLQRPENPLSEKKLTFSLRQVWTMADAGLELTVLKTPNVVELTSNRIFLGQQIVAAGSRISGDVQPVLTYFVNEITSKNSSTPYSFVSAPPFLLPPGMKDDEIIINDWLASDLNVKPGDQISLTYYVLGSKRDLKEEASFFRIRSVVPIRGKYADKNLMPDFPGLADQENCRDWEPGIPIDLEKIRDKDEQYWENYHGIPKAFVTLAGAQKMWRNRFGNLTAMRFPNSKTEEIEKNLKNNLDPESLGYVFRNLKQEGLTASQQSVDFSGLFLGLSFFIVVAALLLTGLLFVFSVEQRSEENGLLLALGFTKKYVKKLIYFEALVLVVSGSLLGAVSGLFYNQIVLAALKTVWHGAVGTSALRLHFNLSTIIFGTLIGIIIAFLTIWLIAKKQVKQPISNLQKGVVKLDFTRKKTGRISLIIGILSVISVFIILATTDPGRGREAFAAFFSAGSLLLMAGIIFVDKILLRSGKHRDGGKFSLFNLALRYSVRKRKRSLTLIALLASGLFIVFTVGANRHGTLQDVHKRNSGTGGFTLFGETTIPVIYDLNSKKGRQFYSLEYPDSNMVKFVQFRVKEGDDASCLNLNRVSTPQLIGVNPEELIKRGSFNFVKITDEVDPGNPWSILSQDLPGTVIPAVADLSVIVWGLGKSVGDTLIYRDENGRLFRVKLVGGLANSIFQGNIIISEKQFIRKYPSISGFRLFLVDSPSGEIEKISGSISRSLQDQGINLTSASKRLAEFNQVENTYFSIFLMNPIVSTDSSSP